MRKYRQGRHDNRGVLEIHACVCARERLDAALFWGRSLRRLLVSAFAGRHAARFRAGRGEHEILRARKTSTPQQCCCEQESHSATRNFSQHPSLSITIAEWHFASDGPKALRACFQSFAFSATTGPVGSAPYHPGTAKTLLSRLLRILRPWWLTVGNSGSRAGCAIRDSTQLTNRRCRSPVCAVKRVPPERPATRQLFSRSRQTCRQGFVYADIFDSGRQFKSKLIGSAVASCNSVSIRKRPSSATSYAGSETPGLQVRFPSPHFLNRSLLPISEKTCLTNV